MNSVAEKYAKLLFQTYIIIIALFRTCLQFNLKYLRFGWGYDNVTKFYLGVAQGV